MRIVSLLPSATEIVYLLGLGDALVGVSHDCDYPPGVSAKPRLSRSVVDPAWSSAEIDRRIREQLHAGQSVYHLDAEALGRLAPDLILTQELCEVCAPSYNLVLSAAKVLEGKAKVVSLEPTKLADILENIRLVGKLTGREALAADVTEGLALRMDHVRRLKEASGREKPRPRVACLEWCAPVMNAGHWVPEMTALAGGEDVLARPGERSCVIPWDAVVGARPDVVVLMPCGFDVARSRREAGLLRELPGWGDLPAVRAGRVYAVDGSSYFNRPGPRIFTGLEILAEILNPEIFGGTAPPEAFERIA